MFNGQMGIGMYETTVICLDGSRKKMQVFFSSIFYEMVYEMRETHRNKKVGSGTGIFMGKKSLAGGTLWDRETSHYSTS